MTQQMADEFIYKGETFYLCFPDLDPERVDFSLIDQVIEKAQNEEKDETFSLRQRMFGDINPEPVELFPIIKTLEKAERKSVYSACWKGYTYAYLYDNDQLFLNNLDLMLSPEDCPVINGVTPSKTTPGKDGPFSLCRWSAQYNNLRLPIKRACNFTIGKDIDIYRWVWHPCISNFKTVLSLEFENGCLVKEKAVK